MLWDANFITSQVKGWSQMKQICSNISCLFDFLRLSVYISFFFWQSWIILTVFSSFDFCSHGVNSVKNDSLFIRIIPNWRLTKMRIGLTVLPFLPAPLILMRDEQRESFQRSLQDKSRQHGYLRILPVHWTRFGRNEAQSLKRLRFAAQQFK